MAITLPLTEALARKWCVAALGSVAKAQAAAAQVAEGEGGAQAVCAGHVWKICAAVGQVSLSLPGERWEHNDKQLRVDAGVVKKLTAYDGF